jgi:hypothetical protein
MDKREEAKFSMNRGVKKYLAGDEVVTATASIPAIALAAAELGDSIDLIEKLETEAAAAARGDAGNKAGLRQLATATALIVDGKITAWAARRGLRGCHQPLQPRAHRLPAAQRRRLPRPPRARPRQGQRTRHPTKQATEEGLTTGHVSTLESRLNAFRAVITAPEDLQKRESALRKLIDDEFEKTDILLDLRLDKLMRELAETHPALFTTYQAAQVIYESGTRTREEPEPSSSSSSPSGSTTPNKPA